MTVTPATDVVNALLPVFIAGFAVQRFLEICDFTDFTTKTIQEKDRKKRIMGISSLVLALILVLLSMPALEILHRLNVKDASDWLDVPVSAFVISAGTDGVNSILKFLTYKKQETQKKASA